MRFSNFPWVGAEFTVMTGGMAQAVEGDGAHFARGAAPHFGWLVGHGVPHMTAARILVNWRRNDRSSRSKYPAGSSSAGSQCTGIARIFKNQEFHVPITDS
jgi:hypothetical protein